MKKNTLLLLLLFSVFSYSQDINFQRTKDSLKGKSCYVAPLTDEREIFITSEKKYGALNNLGKIVIPPNLEQLQNFEDGLAIFKENGSFGIKMKDGNNLLDPQNSSVVKVNNKLFAVKKKELSGLIDQNAIVVIPYEFIFYGKTEELIFASKNDKFGYIKLSDLQFYPNSEIDEIFSRYGIYADLRTSLVVRKNNKFGLMDEASKIIVPIVYDEIFGSLFSIVAVKKDGKFGIIDKNNTILKPFVYDNIQSIKAGFILINKNKKEKYFDEKML
mgnify:CR=1 FL=1